MSICIIPARGGSKRIPRKNIREFCGRPMISWPIRAASESGCFERIVVSTDDEEIADVATAFGAEVPFLRSEVLAGDHTPTLPVIADAIHRLAIAEQTPVCCLYATSPFVIAADLRAGLDRLRKTGAPFVLSVTSYAFPIQRALRRDASGVVQMFDPAHMQTRSQDLEEAWHDAGQFYWGCAKNWAAGKGLLEAGAQGLALPRHRVQDIDTEEDWTLAELMFRVAQAT
ncbi:pseudaminic acid cytidylyltransferase [Maritimibacter sp. DP1N21-5]|uniref:pseudaminic acid cytidylyltransferase n=1 Tax=Maritimibacter sp. DP1N21-5 TaxID=2836867 RepID=UPI001C484559|nr:pseudaminic acid cytidylyltransferase [Maritimibacter sp. DP1N21-5]MBV7410714.1 pseudaminic acid cytidylyltransferase [Maritimibacter sp. DP1N21-5]